MDERKVRKNTRFRVGKKFIGIGKGSVAFVLVAALILGILVIPRLPSVAAFDPSEAIKYKDYRKDHEIENTTLFIGTYLISLKALTDDLYAEADASASESQQTTKYYYSELADGAWRNITDGVGLKDLGPESGVPATEEELAELYITKVIGADGVMVDAKTGQVTDPFGDPDPYDLFHLPELVSLRKTYAGSETAEEPTLGQFLIEHGQTEVPGVLGLTETTYVKGDEAPRSVASDTFAYNAFHDFFASDVHNELTDLCDQQLATLTELYNSFQSEGDEKRAEAVHNLMSKVDSTRRAEVFRQIWQEPEALITPLSAKLLEGVGYESGTFVTNLAETEACATAEEQVTNAYYEKLSDALIEDSTSIIGRYEYDYSLDIIKTSSKDTVDKLIDLWNIRDAIIENQDRERQAIEDDYLPEAESEYRRQITAGVSTDYRAVVKKSGEVAAASYLESQRTEMEHARSEIQLFIDGQRKRMKAEDALDFIFDRIDWTNELYDRIPSDAANGNATAVNDAHILWLRDVIEQILAENEGLRSKLQQMQDELNDLATDRQECLDNNDLQGAKAIEAQMNELQNQINAETAKLNAIINSANASNREKEQAKASLGSGEDKLANSLYNNALGAIADGDTDKFGDAVNGLAGLGASDLLDKLMDRLDKDSGNGNGNGNGNGSGSGSGGNGDGSGNGNGNGNGSGGGSGNGNGNGSGSGNGSGNGSGSGNDKNKAMKSLLNKAKEDAANGLGSGSGNDANNLNALLSALEDFFGKPLSELSGADLAAAIAGLSMLGNKGYTAAATLASQTARANRNTLGFLYDQCTSDRSNEYISLKTIGDVTDYRYVYYKLIDETTMTGLGCSLSFTPNSDVVRNAEYERMTLSGKTVKQKYLYIREADALFYFSCEGENVPLTDLAVCMTPDVKAKAEEFVAMFENG